MDEKKDTEDIVEFGEEISMYVQSRAKCNRLWLVLKIKT